MDSADNELVVEMGSSRQSTHADIADHLALFDFLA